MNWNDRIFAIIIGAFVALFGFSYVIVIFASLKGADPGDWLGFAGAVVGVAGSVGTAMGLTYWQEYRAEQRARKRLVEMLDDFLDQLKFDDCKTISEAHGRFRRLALGVEIIQEECRAINSKQIDLVVYLRGFELIWEFLKRDWEGRGNKKIDEILKDMKPHVQRIRRNLPNFRHLAESSKNTLRNGRV